MKAIVRTKYGPPEVLQLVEMEKPTPEENKVLIKVHAATVNATDPVMRMGKPFIARFFSGLTKPQVPIPGNEFAGEIEAVGGDVKRFKKGDQVFGQTGLDHGTAAEYICLPEEEAIVTKPANMSYEEASTVPDGALGALVFLRRCNIEYRKRKYGPHQWRFRVARHVWRTTRQILWGRSDRGVQHRELGDGEISGRRSRG